MGDGIRKIFQTGLADTSATDLEGVGTIRFEGGKIYKWIKYDNGTDNVSAAAGDFLCYKAVTGYGLSTVVRDQTDADANMFPAGVAQAALTDGLYGWIQIKGFATLGIAFTAGAAGDRMTPFGSTDGALDVSAAHTDNIAGYAVVIATKLIVLDCCY